MSTIDFESVLMAAYQVQTDENIKLRHENVAYLTEIGRLTNDIKYLHQVIGVVAANKVPDSKVMVERIAKLTSVVRELRYDKSVSARQIEKLESHLEYGLSQLKRG